MTEIKKILSGKRIELGPKLANEMNLKEGDYIQIDIVELNNERFLKILPVRFVPR